MVLEIISAPFMANPKPQTMSALHMLSREGAASICACCLVRHTLGERQHGKKKEKQQAARIRGRLAKEGRDLSVLNPSFSKTETQLCEWGSDRVPRDPKIPLITYSLHCSSFFGVTL